MDEHTLAVVVATPMEDDQPVSTPPPPSTPRDFLYNFAIQRGIPEPEANAVVDKLILGGFSTLLAMKGRCWHYLNWK